MQQPKRIKVQKVPQKKTEPRVLLARLCYFYPQYKLSEARRLPYKDVVLLLKEAEKQEATRYYNLTNIAAAPHTKNMSGVKNLISQFERIFKG